jgi:sterol desaturase/sphingolipid hydroxylase (fatty acid hydroxylase superfamily)
LSIPPRLERALRYVLVTPDMHRVHHSVLSAEHNSNFSFSLSLWDRLFGSYQERPVQGHLAMAIGLDSFRRPRDQTITHLLMQPWKNKAAD